MADDRKLYEYEVSGIKHQALLTEEDAKRHKAKVVSNKARQPQNKAADGGAGSK